MARVRIEVRMTDVRGWVLIGETGISGDMSDVEASTFGSEEEADSFMASLEDLPEFESWFERLEEWRVVDAPATSGPSGPSGATQSEEDREAKQTKLRLLPTVRRSLSARAKARGLDMSAYVSALVMADAAGAVVWPKG